MNKPVAGIFELSETISYYRGIVETVWRVDIVRYEQYKNSLFMDFVYCSF